MIWDLRLPPAPATRRFGSGGASHPPASTQARIPGDVGGGGDPRTGDRPGNGPTVLPGRYTVTLTAGSTTSSGTLEVRTDPRVAIGERDLTAQHRFLMSVYDAQLTAGRASTAISSIQGQTDRVTKALASLKSSSADLRSSADAFTAAIRSNQSAVTRAAGSLSGLARNVSRSTSRPTVAQQAALADALAQLKRAIADLNQTLATRVPAFNRQLDTAGVPASVPRITAPAAITWTTEM
jgi:ABC-type transporter Mla subunit MlaD